jgi:hypothetical protein
MRKHLRRFLSFEFPISPIYRSENFGYEKIFRPIEASCSESLNYKNLFP